MAASFAATESTERAGAGTTVTGIATGTASADRISVFQFICNPAPSAISFNGITVGLVNGVDIVVADLGGGTFHILGWIANPTGTTANLVATGSTTVIDQGCASVKGCTLPAFHINGAAAASTTINTPANGCLVACSIIIPPAATTWTNASEDYDYQNAAASARFSMAHTVPTSAATGTTITSSGATNTFAVSFSPANTTTPKSVSVTASTSSSFVKSAGKKVAVTGSGAVATLRQAGKIVAAISSTSTANTRSTTKSFVVACTTTAAFVKQAAKRLAVAATSVVALVVSRAFLVSVAATSATSSIVLKTSLKIVAATSVSTSTFARVCAKSITATSTTVSTVSKACGKRIAAVSATIVSSFKACTKSFSATSATVASTIKAGTKSVAASIVTTSAVAKSIAKRIAASIGGLVQVTLLYGITYHQAVDAIASTATLTRKTVGKAINTTLAALADLLNVITRAIRHIPTGRRYGASAAPGRHNTQTHGATRPATPQAVRWRSN